MTSAESTRHKWVFPTRIRPKSFGGRSSALAAKRIREAVAEIKSVAKTDGALAAEGAVRLIERLSPALETVDSSSGSIGTAVNVAIDALVPVIANAPVPMGMREAWLDRLFAAHEADAIPYIESLADSWGELCGSAQLASDWADRLLEMTRLALSPDKRLRGHYHGTTACLSALLRAGRYGELEALLEHAPLWHDRRYAVRALAAKGEPDAALALAESSRDQWTSDAAVDRLCESILRDAGRLEEAYRYGLLAHRATTHLATFRAIARAYPGIPKAQVLADLVRLSPGEEGKWFAAAKELKLYDEALRLARQSPTDPKTLARAARDFAAREPEFARGAGLLALYWLSLGQGYDITSLDVWMAYRGALDAAARLGQVEATRHALRTLLEGTAPDAFVRRLLRRELDLP